MDRIIDLEGAAAAIDRRRPSWQAQRPPAWTTPWRDGDGSWPPSIQPDRSQAREPDSVGVRGNAGDKGGMDITLFRGGWADLTVVVSDHAGEPINHAPETTTPNEFGAVLDDAINTFW